MVRILLLLVVGGLVSVLLLQYVASESGEVVVLSSLDGDGQVEETRLWVVDHQGFQYLRSGSPEAGWFARLSRNGRVGLVRGEERAAYDAYPQPEVRDEINGLMLAKYGWADQVIEFFFGRDDAIPVRLELYHES